MEFFAHLNEFFQMGIKPGAVKNLDVENSEICQSESINLRSITKDRQENRPNLKTRAESGAGLNRVFRSRSWLHLFGYSAFTTHIYRSFFRISFTQIKSLS